MNAATRNELACKTKGLLRLGGKAFVVRVPTHADYAFLACELRRLAKLKVRSPLAALAEEFDTLPPAMRTLAMDRAMAMKAGGDSEPTDEQVKAQYYTPELCRAWIWWLARDDQPALALEDMTVLVTAENVIGVLAELAQATGEARAFPNSPGQTSSTSGDKTTGPGNSGSSPNPASGPRASAPA